MLGRCYRCTEELTAADGPNLLGCPAGAGTPRHAFHLRCWLATQAEQPVQAFDTPRRGNGRSSRSGGARQAA